MAIEIIPKKRVIRGVNLVGTFFYLSIILFFAAVLVSLLLLGMQFSLTSSIENVKTKINSVATPEDLELERKILLTQKKVNDFSFLINNHLSNKQFFGVFEQLAHPKIFFSSIDLQINKGKATLSGTTDNFELLGQQFLMLEKEDYVKNVNLSKASINKDGKVEFTFHVSFDGRRFKYQP